MWDNSPVYVMATNVPTNLIIRLNNKVFIFKIIRRKRCRNIQIGFPHKEETLFEYTEIYFHTAG